jgi:uncharacterized membrane protein
MSAAPRLNVILYTRQGCHLCEQALAELNSLQATHPHQLVEIDVDATQELTEKFGTEVPVVEAGPYKLKAPFSLLDLQVTLGAARDRQHQIDELDRADLGDGPATWNTADGITYWFSRHYVGVLNMLVIIYLGLPVLAPFLMSVGLAGPATLIYRGYSYVCHQLAYRSFFILGDQPVYPRAAAGLDGWVSYGQATGLGEASTVTDLAQARFFVGNPAMGYKIALCQRDVAIYGGILLFGIIFSLTNRRIPPLPWYLWLLIGILPIALDGLSQMLSQPPLEFLPFRESTPFLRSFTGFLFGYTTAWFGYPLVEDTMRETRNLMQRKLERYRRLGTTASKPVTSPE